MVRSLVAWLLGLPLPPLPGHSSPSNVMDGGSRARPGRRGPDLTGFISHSQFKPFGQIQGGEGARCLLETTSLATVFAFLSF